MSIYRISLDPIAGGDSVASVDIQVDGTLTAVAMSIDANGLNLDDDSAGMEVSFGSSAGFGKNDSRVSILEHRVSAHFLTTGGGSGSNSSSVAGVNQPVFAGERIHVHTEGSGGVTIGGAVFLYVDDKFDGKPKPRRR